MKVLVSVKIQGYGGTMLSVHSTVKRYVEIADIDSAFNDAVKRFSEQCEALSDEDRGMIERNDPLPAGIGAEPEWVRTELDKRDTHSFAAGFPEDAHIKAQGSPR